MKSTTNLTRLEQETIVNFNNEEANAEVYTCSQSVMRKLDKLCIKFPDNYKLIKEDEYSKTYSTSKKNIKFKSPRILTDEQREKLAKKLKESLSK